MLAAIAIVLLIVRQRSLVDELNDVNKRLGEGPSSRPGHAVALLERSVDRVMRHEDDVEFARQSLERALSEMTQGAVGADPDGNIVLRNGLGQSFVEALHVSALV